MSIKFKNKDHEKFYEQCLGRTGSLDPYTRLFSTPWVSAVILGITSRMSSIFRRM